MKAKTCLILGFLLCCTVLEQARSATFYVDPNGTGDYPTIQAAVDAAADGDEIILANGVYSGEGNRGMFVDKSITIRSNGDPNKCVIDGNNTDIPSDSHAFIIENSTLTLKGISIKRLYCMTAIQCWSQGSVRMHSCILSENYSYDPLVGLSSNDNSTFVNCIFSNNSSERSVINVGDSRFDIIYCRFIGNSVESEGVIEAFRSTFDVINCHFIGNTVPRWHGPADIDTHECTVKINESHFESTDDAFCSALSSYAGHISVSNAAFMNYKNGAIIGSGRDELFINGCIFSGNTAPPYDGGGALCCMHPKKLCIDNSTFSNNNAYYYGGAIYVDQRGTDINGITISNSLIQNNRVGSENRGGDGGGIYLCGVSNTVLINNCQILDNQVMRGGRGGGMCLSEASDTVSINKCLISDNQIMGAGWGAGIHVTGSKEMNLKLTNSTIKKNYFADGMNVQSYGGGLHLYRGNLTMLNCSVTDNTASAGSAIYLYDSTNLCTVNCLISGNKSSSQYGTLHFGNIVQALFSCCTFTGNNSYIFSTYNNTQNPIVSNSIFFNNRPGEIMTPGNQMPAISYSCIENGYAGEGNIDCDPCFIANGYWDSNGTAENEDDFWIHGDYRLMPDSNCIDAGDPFTFIMTTHDMNGNPRVMNERIDMGCYENKPFDKPVANAGPNQVAYAGYNGISEVTLDGSASYDDDDDPLSYIWSWVIDGNDCQTNGVSPAIDLPVGEHVIELIVNDGIEDSSPDYVTITVIEPLEGQLRLMPQVINRKSNGQSLIALLQLPQGIPKGQIGTGQSLILDPGGIESKHQMVLGGRATKMNTLSVLVFFDRAEVAESNGRQELDITVSGKLKSGQVYFGRDTVRIISKGKRF